MKVRILTNGIFSANELAEELGALDRLYDLFLFVQTLDRSDRPRFDPTYLVSDLGYSTTLLYRIREVLDPGYSSSPLLCTAVTHNSPGMHDLTGAAEGIRSLFEILREVIFLKRGREIHNLEVLERKEKIKYAAIQRLERTAIVLRDAGIPLETRQNILLSACRDVALLDSIAGQNGVVGIELLDERNATLESCRREILVSDT